MDLTVAMRSFVRVVETGSFSAVAREMTSTQPAISKQIAWLERHLGSRLMERSTRKLALTEEALQYYERAKAILDEIDDAERLVRRGRCEITGTLRLACSVGFGRCQLVPRLKQFLATHPQLRLDLRMSDAVADLIEEGIDIAIRIGDLPDSGLIARRLGTTHRAVVASPAYLKGRKLPRRPQELQDHECIVYSGLATRNEWRFDGPNGPESVHVTGRFEVNSSEGVREAVLAGMGVGFSPVWLFGDELRMKTLKVLLPGYRAASLPIHGVSPPSRRYSAKVKALLDFLDAEFAVDPFVSGYGAAA
ncbi:MAG TPA: LysR family transcriptional regulator [Pseudoxanthomonas sp.]|nr:LysR family transcriptional regulator [Pseudoxanthomonas sp.]